MNSRRAFVKQGALAAAAITVMNPLRSLAISSPGIYGGHFSNENSLTILHTSDLGNQLSAIRDGSAYEGLGGFRAVKDVIAAVRREWKNVLLLDAGGMQSSLFPVAAELNYDAVQLNAADGIQKAMSLHALPVISSGSQALPYRIIQKGNIRVGIVSACFQPGYSNPVLKAIEYSDKLKKEEDCNLVICMSDLGLDKTKRLNDFTLARRSASIDLVIGSGTGSILRTPHTGLNSRKQEVIINHSGYGGLVLGKIDMQFNDKGEKSGITFNNLVIGTPGHKWKGLPAGRNTKE